MDAERVKIEIQMSVTDARSLERRSKQLGYFSVEEYLTELATDEVAQMHPITERVREELRKGDADLAAGRLVTPEDFLSGMDKLRAELKSRKSS